MGGDSEGWGGGVLYIKGDELHKKKSRHDPLIWIYRCILMLSPPLNYACLCEGNEVLSDKRKVKGGRRE